MTMKPTGDEVDALKALMRPFGAGDVSEDVKKSLLNKKLIKQGDPGVLSVTRRGKKAAKK